MAYKCDQCGNISDEKEECCGASMIKEQSDDDSFDEKEEKISDE
ncbi:MAG: hypothetical protein AAB516_01400 [Patescibacteria group bacterium]